MIPNWCTNITHKTSFVRLSFLILLVGIGNQSFAQYQSINKSEAMSEMQRFSSGKRVLYIAAHPDDENTRLIAWFSNALNAETTYLSLTKGSGGQNLIGDELGTDLGVIREQELRAARRIDGGYQRFTDALDFGYSKSVQEVWTKWDHDDLQLQTVRTIRELKPDFIITRFPPDERAGHGHHTASAELAIESAALAADSSFDNETHPWTVQGVWWNTSIWWDKTLKDDPEAIHLDLSGFDPLLGDTYGAIGDAARSMHKCQGFGVAINRGPRDEYFKKLWGLGDLNSFLDKESESAEFSSVLANEAAFALEIGDRAQAISKWAKLGSILINETAPTSDKYQRWQKVMLHLLEVYAEVYVETNPIQESFSHPATLKIQSLNPDNPVHVASVKTPTKNALPEVMAFNPPQVVSNEGFTQQLDLPMDSEIAKRTIRVRLESYESIIMLHLKPIAKLVDRAVGEYREAIAVEPVIHAKFDQRVYWSTGKGDGVGYSIHASKAGKEQWAVLAKDQAGSIVWNSGHNEAELSKGWNHFTAEVPKSVEKGKFTLHIAPHSMIEGMSFSLPLLKEQHKISYPHIGTHYRYMEATSTLAVLDLNKKRIKVGYIEGAGDIMDETLENLGYDVRRITEDTPDLWNEVDAVLVGIRAFNTEKWLMASGDRIKTFVEGGGNFVVTYTTAGRSGIELPTPIPLTVGRDRVTEEDAQITMMNHLVLQKPNRILPSDFDFWVQERGLYFPKDYKGFNEVLSIKESTGINYTNSTIVGHYGKGSVIYTGLSLFRELPAGVPGAMKLLQNILHYDY